MPIMTLRAQIWLWKRRAEARYCLTLTRLLLAKLRYRFLCLAIFLLETPEHLKAIALFTSTHGTPERERYS
jgi:hypothetical protein